MSNNGNNLHDELEKARSKLKVVQESCDAISYAEDFHLNPNKLTLTWFEGIGLICGEVIETMDDIFDGGLKPESEV